VYSRRFCGGGDGAIPEFLQRGSRIDQGLDSRTQELDLNFFKFHVPTAASVKIVFCDVDDGNCKHLWNVVYLNHTTRLHIPHDSYF
jgi:hypothetical protein